MSEFEEIEVNVRQIDDSAEGTKHNVDFLDLVRRLMLAGVGALALNREEAERFLNQLVERGELAQKDAQKLFEESVERLRQSAPAATQVEQGLQAIGAQLESGIEQFFNTISVPSRREIDELSAQIAQLAARVDELRRGTDKA
jgi:poly(hydroxyalkanoate) granule-associated protein